MINNKTRIGFTMHPLWLTGISLEDFLAPLQDAGLNALEFLLDAHQQEWEQFKPLMTACSDKGLYLSFHFPYSKSYSLDGFNEKKQTPSLEELASILALAQEFSVSAECPAVVVVHGAKSKTSPREQLYTDTLAFLRWALEGFPQLMFALENLGPAAAGEIKIADTRQEVLALLQDLADPRVGICWDLGHDALHHRPDLPSSQWLKKVIHVHLHDINAAGLDHFPLVYDRVPYKAWLPHIQPNHIPGSVCLEIKGNQLRDWGIDMINRSLIESICWIKELIDES